MIEASSVDPVAAVLATGIAVAVFLLKAGGAWVVRQRAELSAVPDAALERWRASERALGLDGRVRYRVRTDIDGVAAMTGGATPFQPTVFVSEAVLTDLTPTEQTAVITHELAHVRSRHILRRALLSAIAIGGITYVLASLSGIPLLLFLVAFFGRSYELIRQEYEADTLAAQATSPEAVASGLWAVATGQGTVGDYSRITAVLTMRPSIPDRIRRLSALQAEHAG